MKFHYSHPNAWQSGRLFTTDQFVKTNSTSVDQPLQVYRIKKADLLHSKQQVLCHSVINPQCGQFAVRAAVGVAGKVSHRTIPWPLTLSRWLGAVTRNKRAGAR
jgi:hypothetical protein